VKVLLDSSGWIEFFTGGPLAERYASYLTARHQIITPTIVLYEVYKKIKREQERRLRYCYRADSVQPRWFN
jgi:predicted nucleic acid-binding protein